jgi:RNA polymerase sigma-70 factor (ECF subfamily)
LTLPPTNPGSATVLDFEALYRSARDDLFAYVATLTGDRAAAEDVTATAFERAYRRQAAFDAARGSARGWLFGIARNAALDELRKRKRRATLTHDPADESGPDTALAAADRVDLRTALLTLPVRDREIIALRYHAGLDTAGVAEVLGTTTSNAGTLLHRAMTKLREAMNA